jgi:hypothetical protein
MAYLGNSRKYQAAPYFEEVGDGSTTQFNLGWTPGTTKAVSVSVGGLDQSASTFTVSGDKLTFSTAPASGAVIIVHGFGEQGTRYAGTLIQYKYIATGGQTVFSGADYFGKVLDVTSGYVLVHMNGVLLQQGTDYLVINNTVVLGTGAVVDAEIQIIAFGTFNAAVTGDAVGATGGGTDAVFYLNGQIVTNDFTIPVGQNAMSAGTITIADGVTVTILDNSTWTIV